MTTQPIRTADQALVREMNLSLLLHRLFESPLISRADLAIKTGLNKSTVSSLVQDLIDCRLVQEVGLSSNHVGRPSTLLELNPHAGYIVSAEIGVDFIAVMCTHFGTEIIWHHREPTHSLSQSSILNRTLALIHEAIERGQQTGNIPLLGISVGVPGLVDAAGTILLAPNLEWHHVRLRDLLEAEFPGTRIFVENEANMAALGEYLFGAAKGYQQVLFISAGVGLGGAMILNGQLFKGHSGFASEFGHMTVEPDGLLCKCGNRGCFETVASQAAVFRAICEAIHAGQSSILSEQNLTVPAVAEAVFQNDPVALQAVEQVGHRLGIGLAGLVNAYNPDLVLFGGALSLVGSVLLPIIESELKQRGLQWTVQTTEVALAKHGSDACLIGGVALIYHDILSHPAHFVRSA